MKTTAKRPDISILNENDMKALRELYDAPCSAMSAYMLTTLSERQIKKRILFLEKADYVSRHKVTSDGRVLKWALTRRGVSLVKHDLR